MKNKLSRILYIFNNSQIIKSISRGLIMIIPLIMPGSFALVINNLPIPAYQSFMEKTFGSHWTNFGLYIYNGTFSIISITILISTSYALTESYIQKKNEDISPFYGALVSLACFFSITEINTNTLSLKWLGAIGIFMAVLTALVSSFIFLNLMNIKILRIKIYNSASDRILSQSLKVLLPSFITFVIFSFIHLCLKSFGINDIQDAVYEAIYHLVEKISGTGLMFAIVYVFLSHLLWFLGIHSGNIFEPIVGNFFVPNLAANQELIEQGMKPIHLYTKEFFDVFVHLGGSGASLCLIIALIITVKRDNSRKIAKISLFTSIFNINEIMVYGLPVVFNLFFFIPFIFVPVILVLTTYLAMYYELVPTTIHAIDWTTPALLSGYMATGSIMGSILQFINLIIGVICYMPFVYIFDKKKMEEIHTSLNDLIKIVFLYSNSTMPSFLTRNDRIGSLSQSIVLSLKDDITGKADNLMLEYQPQISSSGAVYGAEALLRWHHKELGLLPPPVIVALAEEAALSDLLHDRIMDMAFCQYEKWQEAGMNFILSINISPSQIKEDFPKKVETLIQKYNIIPEKIELEITEQIALAGENIKKYLEALKKLGIRLAMDDFGMGHGSLMYLKEYSIDTIKLDGALVKDIVNSTTSKDIITSIVHLADLSGIDIIAEYVETKNQRDILFDLNCNIYQGYLYSKSLKPAEFQSFYDKSSANIDD